MVRIIVATVAFGMGLDTPNVRHIIHWGPPEDLELYVQETGREGWDGAPTRATLFYKKVDLSGTRHITEGMRKYCTNVQDCHRQVLMCAFTEVRVPSPPCLHQCCDVCAMVCTYDDCNAQDTTPVLENRFQPHTPPPMLPVEVRAELFIKLEQ